MSADDITIPREDAFDLLAPALTYALPRMTAIYIDAGGWLAGLWPALTVEQRRTLLEAIEAEIRRRVAADPAGMSSRIDRTGWEEIVASFESRIDEPTGDEGWLPPSLAYTCIGAVLRIGRSFFGYATLDSAATSRAAELVERYGVQLRHAHEIALVFREIAEAYGIASGDSVEIRERWLAVGRTLCAQAHKIADRDPEEARWFERYENVAAEAVLYAPAPG